jgi:hypothetical protein
MLLGGVDNVVANRESDRLGPAVNAKLAQDVLDVLADRLRADREPPRDLRLLKPLDEQRRS